MLSVGLMRKKEKNSKRKGVGGEGLFVGGHFEVGNNISFPPQIDFDGFSHF